MIDLRCEYLSVRNSLKVDIAPVSRKPFFDIRGTEECIFTLKCVHGMIITYWAFTFQGPSK